MADKIVELQQSIIKNCNYIYQKLSDESILSADVWDKWWKYASSMDEKYINEDEAIQEFMHKRLQITFRDLQVVRGGVQWPVQM